MSGIQNLQIILPNDGRVLYNSITQGVEDNGSFTSGQIKDFLDERIGGAMEIIDELFTKLDEIDTQSDS